MNTVKKLDYISSFLYENYQLSDMEKNKLKNAEDTTKTKATEIKNKIDGPETK